MKKDTKVILWTTAIGAGVATVLQFLGIIDDQTYRWIMMIIGGGSLVGVGKAGADMVDR